MFLRYYFFLVIFFTIMPRFIMAEGAETTNQGETPQNPIPEKTNSADNDVLNMHSSEVLWLGNEEVAISTRRETPIHKAPSIVTVITDEEIKNSGYRTFAEILRIVPGFEMLKMPDFGDLVPVVRGIDGTNKVRLMIDGHFVNNPLRGNAFNVFDDFPVENIKRLKLSAGRVPPCMEKTHSLR